MPLLPKTCLAGAKSLSDLQAILSHASEMCAYAKEIKDHKFLRIGEYGMLQAQARISALTNNKPIARQPSARHPVSASASVAALA